MRKMLITDLFVDNFRKKILKMIKKFGDVSESC